MLIQVTGGCWTVCKTSKWRNIGQWSRREKQIPWPNFSKGHSPVLICCCRASPDVNGHTIESRPHESEARKSLHFASKFQYATLPEGPWGPDWCSKFQDLLEFDFREQRLEDSLSPMWSLKNVFLDNHQRVFQPARLTTLIICSASACAACKTTL